MLRRTTRKTRKPSLKARENLQQQEEIEADNRQQHEAQKALAAHEKSARRLFETPEQKQQRLRADSQRHSAQLQLETTEQKQQRLEDASRNQSVRLQSETCEQKQRRLEDAYRNQSARLQSETPEQKQQRLKDVSHRQYVRLQSETPEKEQERLRKVSQAMKRKRDSRTSEEKAVQTLKESVAKNQQRKKTGSSLEQVSTKFLAAVREGPDYACNCCHRLMYRRTVLECHISKYSKLSEDVLHHIFPPERELASAHQKVWVCKTCHNTLKKGKMPAQAKANNMGLEDIPTVLSDLNPMEVRLVSLRIPFMKMVALPCGRQRAIHGPAVNVPTDLHPVCNLLPRLPSQTQVVPMKLKRKLSYKGHYMYEYIRPAKVLAALEWLKENNPLYIEM